MEKIKRNWKLCLPCLLVTINWFIWHICLALKKEIESTLKAVLDRTWAQYAQGKASFKVNYTYQHCVNTEELNEKACSAGKINYSKLIRKKKVRYFHYNIITKITLNKQNTKCSSEDPNNYKIWSLWHWYGIKCFELIWTFKNLWDI